LYRLKDQKPGAELKGSVFTLTVVRLLSSEAEAIERDLREKIATGPRFFANAPVVLDLDRVRDIRPDLNFPALLQLLKELALVPVGVRHATPAQQEAAIEAGLAVVKGGEVRELPDAPEPPSSAKAKTKDKTKAKTKTAKTQGPEGIQAPLPKPSRETEPSDSVVRAKAVHRPVRSGQQIYAKNRDLVVLAAVNAGAEVVADGDIHIYGPLRGRALAGAQGDRQARIFCQSMAAELIAIAGHYQVLDESVPQEVRGRAVQIYLEGEKLRIELLT
jgi:septum site-determining protein MinC